MANKKNDEQDGVWRTVGGRRIFIKKGQDLKSAMAESGKFGKTRTQNKNRYKIKYNKEKLNKGLQKNIDRKKESEYKLYKRAKENPDSITPMEENSTDWQRLEKQYNNFESGKYSKEYKDELHIHQEEITHSVITNKEMEELYKSGKFDDDYIRWTNQKLEESIKSKDNQTINFVDNEDRYGKDGKPLNVSLNKYIDKDGKLSPEREALHQEIINSYFEGKYPVPDGEDKVYYMTGGGAGTGKSRFVGDTEKYYGKDFGAYKADEKNDITLFKGNMIKLDADDIKKKLGLNPDDESSAGYFHGESSALVKRITAIAQERGYNVMLDGTGDGGIGGWDEDKKKWTGMIGKIKNAKEKGYKVYANYGTVSIEEALERNWYRYLDAKIDGVPSRLVSPDEVVRTHSKVSQILPELSKNFDGVKLYDTSGKEPKLMASGGNGKSIDQNIELSYNKEYQAFLKKAGYNPNDYKDYYKDRLKEEEVWIEKRKREREQQMKK